MTRATYRFRDFRFELDGEPHAEPVTFALQCAVCGNSGPTSESSAVASAWVWTHLREAPKHLTYREWISRPYRAVPGEWR